MKDWGSPPGEKRQTQRSVWEIKNTSFKIFRRSEAADNVSLHLAGS